MADYQRSRIRVSDTEREDALGKLGQHLNDGRLDLEEYGERTAKVTAAKTRSDVLDLFDDLPDPRPAFGQPAPPPADRAARPVVVRPSLLPVIGGVVAVLLVVGLITWVRFLPLFFVLPFLVFFVHGSWWRYRHRPRG